MLRGVSQYNLISRKMQMDKEKTIKIPVEEYRAFQDHECDAIPSGAVEYTAVRGCDIYGAGYENDMAGGSFYNCLFLDCRFTSLCIDGL